MVAVAGITELSRNHVNCRHGHRIAIQFDIVEYPGLKFQQHIVTDVTKGHSLATVVTHDHGLCAATGVHCDDFGTPGRIGTDLGGCVGHITAGCVGILANEYAIAHAERGQHRYPGAIGGYHIVKSACEYVIIEIHIDALIVGCGVVVH